MSSDKVEYSTIVKDLSPAQTPSLLQRIDRSGIPLLLARLILGGMFIVMGYNKTQDPVTFLKLMRQYDIVSGANWWFLNVNAVFIPWVEMAVGIMLVLGLALRGNALIALSMLVFFTPIVILRALEIQAEQGLAFCGVEFDCGCGAGEVNICFKIAENALLILLALIVMFSGSRKWCFAGDFVKPSRHSSAFA